jgi:hypothetical protein
MFFGNILILVVSAQPILIKSGNDLFYVDSDNNVIKITRTITLEPSPDPENDMQKLSATWVTKVPDYAKRDEDRTKLAAMYLLLSQEIKKGTFKDVAQLSEVTIKTRDMIGIDKNKWDIWGRDISAALTGKSLTQLGNDYASVSTGLAPKEAINPAFIALIIEIIKLIMQLIGS